MNWFVVVLLLAVGVALIFWRQRVAEVEGLVAGGRLHPGCAVAQGVALILFAVVVLLLRPY